jgi:hypothetical protein
MIIEIHLLGKVSAYRMVDSAGPVVESQPDR